MPYKHSPRLNLKYALFSAPSFLLYIRSVSNAKLCPRAPHRLQLDTQCIGTALLRLLLENLETSFLAQNKHC